MTISMSNCCSLWQGKMLKPEQPICSDKPFHPRIRRELKTVQAMIRIYCRANHQNLKTLCDQCRELSEYAEKKLANCPFQENKSTCGKCTVHCYKPDMRKRIIEIMRFSGPKMIFNHPLLACAHLLDERRSTKQMVIDKSSRTDTDT